MGAAAQWERYVVKQVDDVYELSDILRQAFKDMGARRVVVDSVSTLYLTKPAMARGTIMTLKRVVAGLASSTR